MTSYSESDAVLRRVLVSVLELHAGEEQKVLLGFITVFN